MKMDKRIHLQVLYLFICCLQDSSRTEKINTAETTHIFTGNRKNSIAESMHKEQLSTAEMERYSPCLDCYKNNKFPKSIAEKIHSPKTRPSHSENDTPGNTAVPKESEKIIFSRKYSPELRSQNDGFVPVAGPYGAKTTLGEGKVLSTPISSAYKARSESRYPNTVQKRGKSHSPRHAENIKRHQTVQRRAQYRSPKIHDEFTVKESITSGNILGNGNFEIIRGGIYSDQDANEILGSRRISRGFGSYAVPTYHQNRFGSIQTVQFPPFYQRRVQNPLQPIFYPRAPY